MFIFNLKVNSKEIIWLRHHLAFKLIKFAQSLPKLVNLMLKLLKIRLNFKKTQFMP